MRVPKVTVDAMVAVIALASRKSLEPAAKELGLTPSALHKRVQAASRIFGTRLFIGTNDGLRLTKQGEVFFTYAIRAVEQIMLAEETTIASSKSATGHLSVGHSTYLFPRLLALIHNSDFFASRGIRIEHKPSLTRSLVQEVADGRLHAGLGYLPIAHPDLVTYAVAEEPIMVCMANRHPLAVRPVIRAEDLSLEPIIATSRATFPELHLEIDDYFQCFGIKLEVIADAFGPPEAITMAEQKIGICLVAASNVKGSVVGRPLYPQTLVRRCGLFLRQDNHDPVLRSFVDLVLERTRLSHDRI
jgi:DNA-binding transcriptional LysR family regulator